MNKKLFLIFLMFKTFIVWGQYSSVRLWEDTPSMKKNRTKLYVFKAPDSINTGSSVIICPGGSYHHLGIFHEGFKTAQWFSRMGVTAFVLKYRVSGYGYQHPAMIEDLQKAIHHIRSNHDLYKIYQDRLGIIGFSAGGHLALMGGVFAEDNFLLSKDIDTTVNLRPNFVIAIYPVVSMQDSIAHKRSRKSLLSSNFTYSERDKLSLELQIPPSMPPVFLLASKDDNIVDYRNSIVLAQALDKMKVNNRFLLFNSGGHGYGMKKTPFRSKTQWDIQLYKWLKELGML